MSVPNVNSSDISNQILEIFRSNSNNRKGRIETLNQISDLAKGLIDDLNNIDDSIYEITDEIESCYEEYDKLMQDIEDANSEIEKCTNSSDAVGYEITKLEEKEQEGTITETEAQRLKELRERQQSYQEKSASVSGTLGSLTKSSDAITSKITGFSDDLEDVTSAMEEYQKAGTTIKDSANKYGKKNMNVEKAMDRNESSWWGNAAKYGGMAIIGGAGLAVGGLNTAVAIAGTGLVNGLVGGAIGGTAGIGTGIGLGSLFGQGKQMQNYIDKAGYTEIGNNSQVFYDAINHDYIAEYDVLEKKGGNQIQGKMRKATAKTYSYGKTIEVASQNIEKTADEVKLKINEQNDNA